MYPRRFLTQHNPADWALIIEGILIAGWTYAEIEQATGISTFALQRVARSSQTPRKEWGEIFALLDLYVRATHNAPLPLIK